MAALHSALRALAPVDFLDVPTTPEELDKYLAGIYSQAQIIVDSIPIPEPDDAHRSRPRSHNIAGSAAEMTISGERSPPPRSEHQQLQKEWGKPLKLKPQENPLGISVYKLGGKDGRGAWFARKSVHEGLGFARFKAAFEKEFPTSLAVQGAPGEGNVRGIGAETRVEEIDRPTQGKMEVYRLSAQFPGPTTPRDFVTLLLTSPHYPLRHEIDGPHESELHPRQYMIVSKPCNHPETQPSNNFIRGQYESVEFVREIPRKLKASRSSADLVHTGYKHGHTLEQDLLIKNAEKHSQHDDHAQHSVSREHSPLGRKRSKTVADLEQHHTSHGASDDYDPEENAVEWIMVTRSDPGGSVPRFLVERGTPASICADAVKFLDWACQQDDAPLGPDTPITAPKPFRRESFTSGTEEHTQTSKQVAHESFPPASDANAAKAGGLSTPQKSQTSTSDASHTSQGTASSGLLSSMAGAISSYAPQAVVEHLQGTTPKPSPSLHTSGLSNELQSNPALFSRSTASQTNDDALSTTSSLSFASADSHISLSSVEERSQTSLSLHSQNAKDIQKSKEKQSQHDKELTKLSARREQLLSKHSATISKIREQTEQSSQKEAAAIKKAEEKHEKDMKKQQERYQRELKKIEERKEREEKKAKDRKKRELEKDEKVRLTKERDELKERVDMLEREREVWMSQVGELQKENTHLMARIGKYESSESLGNAAEKHTGSTHDNTNADSQSNAPRRELEPEAIKDFRTFGQRMRTMTIGALEGGKDAAGSRSRSSSVLRRKKEDKNGEVVQSETSSQQSAEAKKRDAVKSETSSTLS